MTDIDLACFIYDVATGCENEECRNCPIRDCCVREGDCWEDFEKWLEQEAKTEPEEMEVVTVTEKDKEIQELRRELAVFREAANDNRLVVFEKPRRPVVRADSGLHLCPACLTPLGEFNSNARMYQCRCCGQPINDLKEIREKDFFKARR